MQELKIHGRTGLLVFTSCFVESNHQSTIFLKLNTLGGDHSGLK